jgi:hypothetical protein
MYNMSLKTYFTKVVTNLSIGLPLSNMEVHESKTKSTQLCDECAERSRTFRTRLTPRVCYQRSSTDDPLPITLFDGAEHTRD